MAKSENVALQFLKKQSPFNAGEIAGFPDAVAQRYIKAGIAKLAPSKAEVEEQAAGDAEHWKQKFYGLVPEHDKTVASLVESIKECDALKTRVSDLEKASAADGTETLKIVEQLNQVELDRDKLLRQVNELEGLLTEARAQPTYAKPEVESAAPAAPADQSGEPIHATNKDDAGAQENASGINEASRAAETERRAGRKR